jgi:hypothetical protein
VSAIESWADALEAVREEGAAADFVLDIPGTLNPLTETYTGGSSETCAGFALGVASTQEDAAYVEGSLTIAQFATLFFVPSVFNTLPTMGSVVTWAGVARKVVGMRPLRPSGEVIASRVMVA